MSTIRRNGRGGKREGAGRKPVPPNLKKEGVYIKLPHWLKEWLSAKERHQSAAVIIEEAVCDKYGLTPPPPSPTEAQSDDPA